jgi:hypothetical protein
LTAFGIIVIPLSFLCALSPEWLLAMMIFFGGFESAASLVIGSSGVQLNIIPAVMFMSHLILLSILGGRFVANSEIVRSTSPLLIFLGVVIVGALVLPNVFAGDVSVWPQKSDERAQAVLSFSAANITQTLYMVLNISVTFCCATYVASYPVRVKRLLSTYFASGLAVCAVALWQFASRVGGIPFPDSFFYSNPGWNVLSNQTMGFGIPRINGPFSEPSALAAYLCGIIFASGWLLLHGRSDRLVRCTFVAAIFSILLSTSTTGFLVLTLGAGITGVYVFTKAKADVVRRFGQVTIPVVVLAIVAGLALPILVPSVVDAAGVVIEQTLTKSDSESYDERTQTDSDSLALIVPTYGLGAGWGSNRSSSLIPGVLGNAGLPGLVLLGWAIFGIRRDIRTLRPFIRAPAEQWALQGLSAGLLGTFMANVAAGPTITSLTFYTMLGAVFGILGRARLLRAEARRTGLQHHQNPMILQVGD